MRVLIADKFPEAHAARLREAGHEVTLAPELGADDLPGAISGIDVLVVRSTRVTATTVHAADKLALVIRAGAGYNTVDWQAAADHGIYVCNTPGRNAVAVAELTMGLIAALDRRIPDAVADLRAGRWRKKEYAKAAGLKGRTLGIVGFGDIGREVAVRARAMEMEVLVVAKPGRRPAAERAIVDLGIRTVPDLEALVTAADIVTLHVPAAPETRDLVSARFLAWMRPGAMLVNTSRGDIVDEQALLAALDEKGIRAGLDVYRHEPASGEGPFASALATHPNVYGTHHIGASTEQAQDAIAAEVVSVIEDFGRGVVRNCVNLREQAPAGSTALSVRHLNKVGVLAGVLGVLRRAGLNVEQMQNRILAGGTAATATIQVTGDVLPEIVDQVEAETDVLGVSMGPRWG